MNQQKTTLKDEFPKDLLVEKDQHSGVKGTRALQRSMGAYKGELALWM
jgi:hypothetical protein